MTKRRGLALAATDGKRAKGSPSPPTAAAEEGIPGAEHCRGGCLLPRLPRSAAAAAADEDGGGETPAWLLCSRARLLTSTLDPREAGRCVVYWMNRDQRAEDNWAMLFARETARQHGVPLKVVYNLAPCTPSATLRHTHFLVMGLAETEAVLRTKSVAFHLLRGEAADTVPAFAAAHGAAAVFTDMSPLREPSQWAFDVAGQLDQADVPLVQVDAHNVVPVWIATDKQEVGARTLRPKLHKLLPTFGNNTPPALEPNEPGLVDELPPPTKWEEVLASFDDTVDRAVAEVSWAVPGPRAGRQMLADFCEDRIRRYADHRNDPNEQHALSVLSPWFNFGHLAPQRALLEVKAHGRSSSGKASFVEEAVVRRELSDNFCFHNSNYDRIEGAAGWAQESLALHAKDEREFVYSSQQLDGAQTHDDLWNAAQLQLTREGKMHGFLRMYWAKKILEWTLSPQEALKVAISLNDRYSLDGLDPNGYVGCMWSVAGVHDQGWKEREVFGKIRFMNYAGCQRKFDVAAFVARYPPAADNAVAAGGVPAKPKVRRASVTGGRKAAKK